MGVSDGSDVAGRNPVDAEFSIYPEATVYSVSSVERITTSRIPSRWRHAAISIGNFDGVHRGHQRLIQRLRDVSRRLTDTTAAIAVTFDPSPGVFLSREAISAPLTTLTQKVALLLRAGVDAVWVLKTTPKLLTLSPEAFFQQILVDQFQTRAVIEGVDFRFGVRRTGTVTTLQSLCDARGISFDIVSPFLLTDSSTTSYEPIDSDVETGVERDASSTDSANSDATAVSSSRIRRLILSGEVAGAARLLGRYHESSGIVVHGEHRGRTLGYPTANLAQIPELLPADGVYAGRVTLSGTEDGRDGGNKGNTTDTIKSNTTINTAKRTTYAAAVALGPNSTFGGSERKCEIFILDFQGDLYGKTLRLEWVERIRGLCRFDSVDGLLEQMRRDVIATRVATNGSGILPMIR